MNVLLLSMPDSFEHTAPVTMRMPNGALGSLAGNIDPHHRVAIADLILVHGRVRETVERLVRDFQPDLVGLSIMTFQRRTAQKLAAHIRSLCPVSNHRRRRVRSEPRPRRVRSWRLGDRLHRARRGGHHAPRAGPRPRAGERCRVHCRDFVPDAERVRADASAGGEHADRRGGAPPESRRACAGRLHVHRPPDRCRRNLARLHLRLQLLLDHRDARTEFPHVVRRTRSRRYRRRAGARCPGHLHRRRQHHAERRALRGAVPGDHRCRPQRHRLHRAGHDVIDRRARRFAGAADARGGIPLRVPGHRKHPGGGPRSFCVPAARTRHARAAVKLGTRRSRPSTCCTGTACSSSVG